MAKDRLDRGHISSIINAFYLNTRICRNGIQRPYLKKARIEKFNIKKCEFTGKIFENDSSVEFAHIESVVTNPFKALDLDNGVIILKEIHKNITKSNIHSFNELYRFCLENDYALEWAN